MSTERELPQNAVLDAAVALAYHSRLNPPSGECTCGHVVPLGEMFTGHLARVALDASRHAIILDYLRHQQSVISAEITEDQ